MEGAVRFSGRTDWDFRVNDWSAACAERRAQARACLDLTESNPTRCGFFYPVDDILAPLAEARNLVYRPEPRGLLIAREAVRAYYARRGVDIPIERIVLTAGTSEAYGFLFRLLADPGTGMCFPRPSYPLFDFLARLNDVRQIPYPLTYRDGWRIDPVGLRAALSASPRAVVLVHPNNPTGSFVRPEDLRPWRDAAAGSAPALISDEVFLDYPFEDVPVAGSLAAEKEILTFVLGGLSKSVGLPQMKLSWIVVAGPRGEAEEAVRRLEVIADTHLSVNIPVQHALPRWLDVGETVREQILERVRANRTWLERETAETQVRCLRAEGGWYAVLRLPEDVCEEPWTVDLVRREGVLVHPGYFFDFPEEPFIVVSLLPPPDVFREGVRRILGRAADRGARPPDRS